jgi:Pyridoxamine 5'-phosphate oxidase
MAERKWVPVRSGGAGREPIETTNLDIYGSAVLPWSRPRDLLIEGPPQPGTPFFLGTVRPDGRPHTTSVGAIWHDGDLYFTSGPESRKSRNLALSSDCTIAVGLRGIDLVLEGKAVRVTDSATLELIASLDRASGWPAQVDGDAITAPYSAPSAGPPPWYLYRFIFDTAFGVATAEPWGATRWRFAPTPAS